MPEVTKPSAPAPVLHARSQTNQSGTLKQYGVREWKISPDLHPDPRVANFLATSFTPLQKRTEAYNVTLMDLDSLGIPEPEDKTIAVARTDGASFNGMDFSGYTFDSVMFANADFSGANFRGAKFGHATFLNCRFSGVDMSGADFFGALIVDPEIGPDASGAPDFSGAKVVAVTIRSSLSRIQAGLPPTAGLHGANFREADFSSCDFQSASLVDASLEGTKMHCVTIRNSNFAYARFDGVQSRQLHIEDSNLLGATFVRAKIASAVLKGVYSSYPQQKSEIEPTDPPCFDRANFQCAAFYGCVLPGASFVGATFRNVVPKPELMSLVRCIPEDRSQRPQWYMQQALAQEAEFRHIQGDLRWADFRESCIERSALTDVDFDGAKFDGARIDGSGFIRCALGNANLEADQGVHEDDLVHCSTADSSALSRLALKHASADMPATWPPGFIERVVPNVAPSGPIAGSY